ncbi:MAG: prepilin peptidase, partial [Actinomycetota bacterium]
MTAALDTTPLWFWAAAAGALGLALGSFFTVAAHRWPREESLVHPRSHCTACARTLRWYELVPVLSWVAQGGRCRGCGAGISWRYPAIELASGALAATAIASFGATPRGAAAMILLLALVPVVVIDLEHKLIPDVIVLPSAAAALALAVAADPARWWVPVAAAGGASLFLLVLSLV